MQFVLFTVCQPVTASERVTVYLLCRLYGDELMLPFGSAHISKCPVIRYVSGDEGDLVYHVLVFNHLSYEERGFISGPNQFS